MQNSVFPENGTETIYSIDFYTDPVPDMLSPHKANNTLVAIERIAQEALAQKQVLLSGANAVLVKVGDIDYREGLITVRDLVTHKLVDIAGDLLHDQSDSVSGNLAIEFVPTDDEAPIVNLTKLEASGVAVKTTQPLPQPYKNFREIQTGPNAVTTSLEGYKVLADAYAENIEQRTGLRIFQNVITEIVQIFGNIPANIPTDILNNILTQHKNLFTKQQGEKLVALVAHNSVRVSDLFRLMINSTEDSLIETFDYLAPEIKVEREKLTKVTKKELREALVLDGRTDPVAYLIDEALNPTNSMIENESIIGMYVETLTQCLIKRGVKVVDMVSLLGGMTSEDYLKILEVQKVLAKLKIYHDAGSVSEDAQALLNEIFVVDPLIGTEPRPQVTAKNFDESTISTKSGMDQSQSLSDLRLVFDMIEGCLDTKGDSKLKCVLNNDTQFEGRIKFIKNILLPCFNANGININFDLFNAGMIDAENLTYVNTNSDKMIDVINRVVGALSSERIIADGQETPINVRLNNHIIDCVTQDLRRHGILPKLYDFAGVGVLINMFQNLIQSMIGAEKLQSKTISHQEMNQIIQNASNYVKEVFLPFIKVSRSVSSLSLDRFVENGIREWLSRDEKNHEKILPFVHEIYDFVQALKAGVKTSSPTLS